MTFICRGICDFMQKTTSRYNNGAKRCSMCSCFFETDDLHCPCCGAKLRTKSRNASLKNGRKESKQRVNNVN
ncbi:hypothetical protein C4565_07305 [Candidatus Parcubacteria bacterium]|nr:MAG: hypothetical protein C4565_07305 [Candidatus Parcubacteria bacterium]